MSSMIEDTVSTDHTAAQDKPVVLSLVFPPEVSPELMSKIEYLGEFAEDTTVQDVVLACLRHAVQVDLDIKQYLDAPNGAQERG